jgi:Cdc6-like AAA superfamily ATPase
MRSNIVPVFSKPYELAKTQLTAVSAKSLAISNIQHRINHKFMTSGQSITIDLEVLSQQEHPKKLMHREAEYRQLVWNLKNSVNTLVYGPHGSGKTALLKQAAAETNSGKVRVVYIDCSLYQTANAVLREILIDRPVASRSNYDLLKKLMERARNTKFVVCLDHIERMKQKEMISQLIQAGICVVIAAETVECLSELGLTVKTSIGSMVELRPYTTGEAVEIVHERMAGGIGGVTCLIETIMKIVQTTKGNIASILSILKVAALRAQHEKRESIQDSDLEGLLSAHDCAEGLNADERLILKILHEWKSLPASRLRDFYIEKSRYPKGERAFRNYMGSLCSKGLVRAQGEARGRIYEIIEGELNGEKR